MIILLGDVIVTNQKMADVLDWQTEDVDCDWDKFYDGYAYGFVYTYGRNNNPYTAIKREIDRLIAYVPTNEGLDFNTSDWCAKFRS